MDKSEWIWMPHAGYFCLSDRCQFQLSTCVGRYIVYTEMIGSGGLYETRVFKAIKNTGKRCCSYQIAGGKKVDFAEYNTAEEAYKGHLEMCEKWAKKSDGK